MTVVPWTWHDWDGSTDWWGQVRWVEIAPFDEWAGFRTACLERLRGTPLVVLKETADGSIKAYFCHSAQSVRRVRQCPAAALPQNDPPWVCLCEPGEKLSLSFETSSDSSDRKEFFLWCLQQLGRCSIAFDP